MIGYKKILLKGAIRFLLRLDFIRLVESFVTRFLYLAMLSFFPGIPNFC